MITSKMEKEDPTHHTQQAESDQLLENDPNEEAKTEVANTRHIDDASTFYLEAMRSNSEAENFYTYNQAYETPEMMRLTVRFFSYEDWMNALFFQDDDYDQCWEIEDKLAYLDFRRSYYEVTPKKAGKCPSFKYWKRATEEHEYNLEYWATKLKDSREGFAEYWMFRSSNPWFVLN
jgi:hypothetical protein